MIRALSFVALLLTLILLVVQIHLHAEAPFYKTLDLKHALYDLSTCPHIHEPYAHKQCVLVGKAELKYAEGL